MTSVFQYGDLDGRVVDIPVRVATTLIEGQVLATTFLEAGDRVLGMDTESTNWTLSDANPSAPMADLNLTLPGSALPGTPPTLPCSTIQVATPSQIGIFQLTAMKSIPSALRKLLTSKNQIKVGVDLTGDVDRLRPLGLECRGWIDLQVLATAQGIPAVSMADLSSRFLPQAPPKDPLGHRGNWDGPLTPSQLYYAATDAYISMLLYYAMMRTPVPEPRPSEPDSTDDSLIVNWIKLQLATAVTDRSFKRLVNQIVNSYGPWRNRYLESERRSRAESTLRRLIQTHTLPFDEIRQVFPSPVPVSSPVSSPVSVPSSSNQPTNSSMESLG
jgi:hypothetical protein